MQWFKMRLFKAAFCTIMSESGDDGTGAKIVKVVRTLLLPT